MTVGSKHERAIIVNGAPVATCAATLNDLVVELGLQNARIATARNGDFVPARVRGSTPLSEGDSIEVVSPRHGG